jgi:PAS domain S-box-containing protein
MPPTDDFQRRHLAAIVDSSDDAIVSKNLDGVITSWNRAAERMFGYTAAEAIGQSIRLIIPADRQHEEDFVLGEVRAGRGVSHFETIRQTKSGAMINISLTVSPILGEGGRIVGASKIARDITADTELRATAIRQAEIARQLSEFGGTIASSLDQSTIVQLVTDTATSLTAAEFGAFFYNVTDPRSGESYMLYTLAGAPKSAFDKFPQPRSTAIFAPTFHGTEVVRLDDVTADPRYGHNAPYHGMPPGHLPVRAYLAVPVKAANGEVLGGLFFGHSTPGVFTAYHEQLAIGLSAWAAIALENARLYQRATEADRMKDDFLAVLSHELRTPLSALLGYSRLIRGGLLDAAKTREALEVVERNARSLTQIVEDVLDVSRIVAGKIRLDVQPVELPVVIHNAVATVQLAADAKSVRIQTVIDPRVGPVSGDPDRLQQVVWNLLSNAVKFTPRHGRVQVRVERVNSHVEIVVSDTGEGIPAEVLPHVFERFRQASTGTTRRHGGLGLGLSIVRHLVELHGGKITAASEGLGQGSTFCVELPLMIVHPAPPAPREHPRADQVAPLGALSALAGIRVMAIDDDADALQLLQTVLEAAGAKVTARASAAQALDDLSADPPDVLVADIGMPGMDGYEFIQAVRASSDPNVRDIPAAALTAFARADDRIRVLQSGFEMHLAKPVDPGELAAAVARLARRRSAT